MAQSRHPISSNVPNQLHRLGPMKLRGALGLLAAILVIGLVGWMYLSQASEVAGTERRIGELRQQKEGLQRQNDQLTYEIGRLASVDRLEKRARELGYVPVSQARFLVVGNYPAQDRGTSNEATTLVQGDSAKRPTPLAVAGWWKAVADQFEMWTRTDQP